MKKTNIFKFATVVISAAGLVGCATFGTLKPVDYHLPAGHAKFIPVGAFINRNKPTPRFYVNRLDAVEAGLKETEAFFAVGSNVVSDYYIDITLDRESKDNIVDFAGNLVTAGTLFLVPSKVHNYNVLTVDVYGKGHKIKTYQYRGDYEEVLSLYNDKEIREGGDEFVSIHNLVNEFVRDLDNDNILPRIGRSAPIPASGVNNPGV